ncbi:MAG TPA: LuxR C-terminal-related transcriptional regulator [Candidatus Limnocylindria bacterium]|nr:LuxR C-terminal-related transcriptional regulator [Candidatus Limnocylindria bacterium]
MSASDSRSGHDRRTGTVFHLTPRERQILELVLRGEQNKEIAAQLGLAEQSVKVHVSHLLRKFAVRNRASLGEAGAHLDLVGEAMLERSWFPQFFRGASVQIAVTRGPNHLYVAVNDAFAKAVGRDVVGQTMREAFPDLAGSGYLEVADRVYQTGESFVAHEAPAVWDRGSGASLTYTDAVLQALRGDDGAVEGLVFFAIDVTEQVASRSLDPSAKPSPTPAVRTPRGAGRAPPADRRRRAPS